MSIYIVFFLSTEGKRVHKHFETYDEAIKYATINDKIYKLIEEVK